MIATSLTVSSLAALIPYLMRVGKEMAVSSGLLKSKSVCDKPFNLNVNFFD